MSIHAVTRSQKYIARDNSIPPALHINSGETIVFDYPDVFNGPVKPGHVVGELRRYEYYHYHREAQAWTELNDVLRVDIPELVIVDWGWTAALPGLGFLAEEFDAGGLTPALKTRKLDQENGWDWFDEGKGIRIPLRSFCEDLKVAPAEPDKLSTILLCDAGGNIDPRHVVADSTLYPTVDVDGALFSCGDGHAAQGHSEVMGRSAFGNPGFIRFVLTEAFAAGTAIETPIEATLHFAVLKDKKRVNTPHIKIPPAPASTTGVESNILDATKAAVRRIIDILITAKLSVLAICGCTQSLSTCLVMLLP